MCLLFALTARWQLPFLDKSHTRHYTARLSLLAVAQLSIAVGFQDTALHIARHDITAVATLRGVRGVALVRNL